MSLCVNLYGNVCNTSYVIAKFLRDAGVDARLFVEANFPWLPEGEDPELQGNYPEWIHVTPDLRWRRYGVFDRKFVQQLADCDVIHASYYGPIWARKTGRPFVFQTYGGDLNVLPFMTDSLHHRYLAWAQRRGIRDASMVLIANPNWTIRAKAVRRLGLERVMVMPLPIDTDVFRDEGNGTMVAGRARYDVEWVFLHPARHIWQDTSPAWEQKGNDRVFRAFARFLNDTKRTAKLVSIRHGADVRASERLVRELGIGSAVEWIAPVPRRKLVELYTVADIVLDQFVLGAYGGCTLEALSCGRPVFVSLVDGAERPPVVNVSTEEEIYKALIDYTSDGAGLRAIGSASRQWIVENHDARTVIRRYIAVYEQVLARDRST